MSYWKIIGGAAAGVGAIVCLPVFGAVGAITAVGAAVGAAVGGLGGAAVASSDEEEKATAYEKGEQAATAKHEREVTKLHDALRAAQNKLNGDKTYFQLLLALFAVGMATLEYTGNTSAEKIHDLEEFVGGISHAGLPKHIKQELEQLKSTPPNFNTAMGDVKKLDNPDMSLFESVIFLMSESDGKSTNAGWAFSEAVKRAA
jgi:hypothetical protein